VQVTFFYPKSIDPRAFGFLLENSRKADVDSINMEADYWIAPGPTFRVAFWYYFSKGRWMAFVNISSRW